MRISRPALGFLVAVLQGSAVLAPSAVAAQPLQLAQTQEVKPLAAVLRTIKAQIPGRALDARRSQQDGQIVYRVKWLGEDGQVREITADARSGRILRVR